MVSASSMSTTLRFSRMMLKKSASLSHRPCHVVVEMDHRPCCGCWSHSGMQATVSEVLHQRLRRRSASMLFTPLAARSGLLSVFFSAMSSNSSSGTLPKEDATGTPNRGRDAVGGTGPTSADSEAAQNFWLTRMRRIAISMPGQNPPLAARRDSRQRASDLLVNRAAIRAPPTSADFLAHTSPASPACRTELRWRTPITGEDARPLYHQSSPSVAEDRDRHARNLAAELPSPVHKTSAKSCRKLDFA